MSYSVGSAGFAGGKLEADIPALTYPSCEQMTIGEDWEATAAKKKGSSSVVPRPSCYI